MTKIVSLDANLLVLLIVGLTDERYVAKHRRLQAFSVDDYKLLRATIARFDEMIVTPNALTEASNLLRYIEEPARSNIGTRFRAFIEITREVFITSKDASAREEFIRLGVSDSALLEIASKDICVLSTDVELWLAALRSGYNAANFTHAIEAARI